MKYKIELRYFNGWDDAGWTEEIIEEIKSLTFDSVDLAQMALDEFFTEVNAAVIAGNMDSGETKGDYRIVAVSVRH